MKRLLNVVKNILKDALGFLLYICGCVLNVIAFLIVGTPLSFSILMSILCIGGFIICVLKGVEMDWSLWTALIVGIIFLVSVIYVSYYEILLKRESNCRKRLNLKLTNEFQEVQIRYSCSKKDLANIALEKLPYVFKARIFCSTIEYQFETKDGEIIYRGTTTDCLWFEKNVYL